jgi:hypothetical protein
MNVAIRTGCTGEQQSRVEKERKRREREREVTGESNFRNRQGDE